MSTSDNRFSQQAQTAHTSANGVVMRLGARIAIALAMLTFFTAEVASALESDRKQPIEINADQAELDESKGEAHYMGNVVLTQGSLIIRADTLIIKADAANQIKQVTASGKPAEFNQTPEAGKPPVVAKAKLIDYYVADEKLVLQQDAIVVQNDSTFQGSQIQYDIRNHRMQATSNGKKTGVSERVKMILPPSTSPETPTVGADAPGSKKP